MKRHNLFALSSLTIALSFGVMADDTAGQKAEVVEQARVQEIKDLAAGAEAEAVLMLDEAEKKMDSMEKSAKQQASVDESEAVKVSEAQTDAAKKQIDADKSALEAQVKEKTTN
ncbi:hypothetical protein [Enterovibrio sp. 27052020O]|uniref:hypothetical protein n=1 Tax=Enterovibrio sp. 27052020O TaxID=3241166 RepID=UPI00388E87C3